ncbi:mucin-5AC-like [Mytilus edulis]|uniref:mucin-5AC-like n=1 Tax=Mytilus edulis TaxID=6550 RepID=UPI0039F14DF2
MGFRLRWFYFIAVSHYFPFVMSIVCKPGMNYCEIENWASWEPCNSTCGQGLRKRQKIICCQNDLLTKCLESCGITRSWWHDNATEFMSCGTCMIQGIFRLSKNNCNCSSDFRDYVISKTSLTPLTTASRFTKLPNLNSHKCVSRWTPWVNKDKPWINKDNINVDIGESDHEFLTPEELEIFCPRGNITKVECMVDSVHPIPYYSTGEIVRCDKHHGLVCNNADNFPVPCHDYKIRYYCICPVETTKPTFAMKSTSKTTTNIKPKPTQHRKTFLVTIQPIDSTSDKHLVKPTATKSHQASTKQASPIQTWAILLIATACFVSIVICCFLWCCCCNKGGKKKIQPDMDNT